MPSECAGNPYFTLRTFSARALQTCLLRSHIADEWQPELLIAVGLDHQENLASYKRKEKEQSDQKHQRAEESVRHNGQNASDNPDRHPQGKHSDIVEYRLKSMETNDLVILVRLNHQKNQAGNPTDEIAETCSHIVGHPRARCTRR